MTKYVVYSKDNCTFCKQAINLLLIKKKQFEVKKLDVDFSIEDFVVKFPETRTFPAITKDDEYIGGYAELRESL